MGLYNRLTAPTGVRRNFRPSERSQAILTAGPMFLELS
jgi:hypothetical protein